MGGPIKKNKTFFFADIQNKFQRHGIAFTGLVPTVAMRNGDFTNDAFGNPRSGFLVNPNVGGSADTAFQCDGGREPASCQLRTAASRAASIATKFLRTFSIRSRGR